MWDEGKIIIKKKPVTTAPPLSPLLYCVVLCMVLRVICCCARPKECVREWRDMAKSSRDCISGHGSACVRVFAQVCTPHRRREIGVECEAAADAPVRDAAGCRIGCFFAFSFLRALHHLSHTEKRFLLLREEKKACYRHRHYLLFLASSPKHYDRRIPPGMHLV